MPLHPCEGTPDHPRVRAVEESGAEVVPLTSAFIAFLNTSPGFKDSNALVVAEVFKLVTAIAKASSSFGKAEVALVLPYVVAKLSDRKIAPAGLDLLSAMAESTGPRRSKHPPGARACALTAAAGAQDFASC